MTTLIMRPENASRAPERRTENPKVFPKAKSYAFHHWRVDPKTLEAVAHKARHRVTELSLKQAEAVVCALADMGYLIIGEPND